MIDTEIHFNGNTVKKWSYKDHFLPCRRFFLYTPTITWGKHEVLSDEWHEYVKVDFDSGIHLTRTKEIGFWSIQVRLLGFGFGYCYQETY